MCCVRCVYCLRCVCCVRCVCCMRCVCCVCCVRCLPVESVWFQNVGLRYKFKVDVLEASPISLFLHLANSHGEDGRRSPRNNMCIVVLVYMKPFLVSDFDYSRIMRLQGLLLFFSNICLCVNETNIQYVHFEIACFVG